MNTVFNVAIFLMAMVSCHIINKRRKNEKHN